MSAVSRPVVVSCACGSQCRVGFNAVAVLLLVRRYDLVR